MLSVNTGLTSLALTNNKIGQTFDLGRWVDESLGWESFANELKSLKDKSSTLTSLEYVLLQRLSKQRVLPYISNHLCSCTS